MRATATHSDARRILIPGVGFAVVIAIALVVAALMRTSYDLLVAALVAPVLVVISLPALFRQATREADPRLNAILLAALLAKLAGALARYTVSFGLYGGRSDATAYWSQGLVTGPQIRQGIFTGIHLYGLSGTNFTQSLSGLTVAAVGPSLLAGFLIFSWIGFWGLFLFYRAFTIAVPEGRRRWYAGLIFFLPSLVFWPSGVGKEAWMMLGLGLAAFGAARILTGRTLNGFVFTGLGLIACALVRPHIAAMVVISLVIALLVRPSNRSLGALAPVVKLLVVVPLVVVTILLIARTQAFLRSSGINTNKGVSSVLSQTANRTQKGSSRFAPSILSSPWDAPVAAVTVLFRPLLYDASDIQSLFAAFEGTLLIALCIIRWRWIGRALRLLRRRTYLMLCLVYLALFVAAYSSIANFGILVRERVQVMPFLLALLCIPPRTKRFEKRVGGREAARPKV